VTFKQGLSGAIDLQKGELPLNTSINIDATGANIAIDGHFASRVFNFQGTASEGIAVNLTDLSIEHGLTSPLARLMQFTRQVRGLKR
jgi:hypothetical protein